MHAMTLSIAALAALGLSVPSVIPQDETRPEIVRVPQEQQDQKLQNDAGTAKQDRARLDALVEQLGSPDFEERRAAAKKLQAEGAGIRDYLQKHLREADDPELRWQLRRLLRELDGDAPQLEREDRRGELRTQRPGRSVPELRGLDEELQRMRQEMDAMIRRLRSGQMGLPGLPGGMQELRQSQGTRIQIQPGKVVVEIETDENGKPQRYEAESLEKLLEKHPELKDRVGPLKFETRGLPGGFGFRMGPGLDFDLGDPFGPEFGKEVRKQVEEHLKRLGVRPPQDGRPELFPRQDERLPRGLREDRPAPRTEEGEGLTPDRAAPTGPKLGIYIRDGISADLREHLGLDERQGLWVEGLAEGGLAEQLGIQEKDILIELDGKPISSPADVAAALSGRDGNHEAVVVRKGQRLQLPAK